MGERVHQQRKIEITLDLDEEDVTRTHEDYAGGGGIHIPALAKLDSSSKSGAKAAG